jgi:hypothetical protein
MPRHWISRGAVLLLGSTSLGFSLMALAAWDVEYSVMALLSGLAGFGVMLGYGGRWDSRD